MGFCLQNFKSSKSQVVNFVWNQYFEKFAKKNFRPPPPKKKIFYNRFRYMAPSSDHPLLTLKLPFKVILRRFQAVFWCLELERCAFQKTDENSFKSANYEVELYCRNKGRLLGIPFDLYHAHVLQCSNLYVHSSTNVQSLSTIFKPIHEQSTIANKMLKLSMAWLPVIKSVSTQWDLVNQRLRFKQWMWEKLIWCM